MMLNYTKNEYYKLWVGRVLSSFCIENVLKGENRFNQQLAKALVSKLKIFSEENGENPPHFLLIAPFCLNVPYAFPH